MRRLAASSFLSFTLACSGGMPSTSPTIPASATKTTATAAPQAPTPSPAPAPAWTASGTAWVFDGVSKRRADSGYIFGWVDFGDGNGGETTGTVPVGSDGRFSFAIATGTARVWVNPGSIGYKPCLSTVRPTGDVSLDAYYVTDTSLLGAHLPQELIDLGPTLSGQVYEETSNGRVPVPNHWVYLDGLYGDDLVVATTRTDVDGRYAFCNMQNLPSLVLVAGGDAFGVFYSAAGVGSHTTLDVALKRSRP